MRIFVDVEEAAERFEELIELAHSQDEVYVWCRGGRPAAMLTSMSGRDDRRPDETAETVPDAGVHPESSMLAEVGKISLRDEFRTFAATGKPSQPDLTSAHDDLYDADGSPG
jgi:hypothetical protein